MSLTNCRFYEEKFPEVDSFVMVNVKQVGCPGSRLPLSMALLVLTLTGHVDRRNGSLCEAARIRQH